MTHHASLPTLPARWLDAVRRFVRGRETAFVAVCTLAGIAAAATTVLQALLAHRVQQVAYGLSNGDRLSTLASATPQQLAMLPIGGLVLAAVSWLLRSRKRPLVDVVEANALHGGRMSMRDSLVVSAQTLVSNGFGASVGLEAAYVQLGGGLASLFGRVLQLRRADMRVLVGAGSGAAIAAAFGAPLTGAFYAYEIVIGAYTPASLAPVAAACLASVGVASLLGYSPYLLHAAPDARIGGGDLAATLLLAIICAGVGIALLRLVPLAEKLVRATRVPPALRPFVGGLCLIPLAAATPQVLSAGHAALTADLAARYSLAFVGTLILLKCAASIVSLAFGFRGGLFFASLFLGALVGHLFAGVAAALQGHQVLAPDEASLIGMAALAVAVVGGPLTLSMLVLEATRDFGLTSLVMAAVLVCNVLTRTLFGFNFSTWRLHLRGETVRSARDVGWMRALTARSLMRTDVRTAPVDIDVAGFRRAFPLGSTSRVVLVDEAGRYAGLVSPVTVHGSSAAADSPVAALAQRRDVTIPPGAGVARVMRMFDSAQADDLVVIDDARHVLGIVTETHARKRYAEELDKSQRELFGET
jgi:CIC family chloride channel protein